MFLDRVAKPSNKLFLAKLTGMNLHQLIDLSTKKINKRFEIIEPNIYKNTIVFLDVGQSPGSIGWLISSAIASDFEAKNLSKSALIAEEASRLIVEKFKLNLDQIIFGLPDLNIHGSNLWRQCPKPIESIVCYPGQYRSYSGHCNNVEHPDWGCAHQPYRRGLASRYADGVSKVRRSITGSDLPSARDISVAIHQGSESPFAHITTLTSFLGQFIFHDLSHTVQTSGYNGQRIRCCNIQRSDLIHPECYPIRISESDRFMKKLNQKCMEYVRSSPTIRERCSLGPREQINQVSSFLDGSAIYGSSKERALSLRSFRFGQLKSIKMTEISIYKKIHLGKAKELLPIQEDDSLDCRTTSNTKCFHSGDNRVNENLGLTIIHTLFLREHNRIAKELSRLNPHWNDDELFEETRKIIGAQIQHITYNEFLPFVLGEEIIENYGLRLLRDDYYDQYDRNIDPTIENAVANAVFYFLFSTMPSEMQKYTKKLDMVGSVKMTDSFFNPSKMLGDSMDQFLMGMVSQNAKSSDTFVTSEMTNSMDEIHHELFDFVAIAIQRGRDHGLPGYVEYRRACQIEPKIDGFEDLSTIVPIDILKRLKTLYKNVRDIDLFTGGLAERPLQGALVGPTFACLLGRQFNAIRRGDRFWYENDQQPSAFSLDQLAEIRKSSLARIICDNGDQTDFVQPSVMISSDTFLNAFQYCIMDIIPKMDLSKWKTKTSKLGNRLPIDKELIKTVFIRAKREVEDFIQMEQSIIQSNMTIAQTMHYKTSRWKRQAAQGFFNQSFVLERTTQGILRKIRKGRDRETNNDIVDDIRNLVSSLPQNQLNDYLMNQFLIHNQMNDFDQCFDQSLPCDHTSPFRTINGWCNNLHRPEFGSSYRLFNRFLLPVYEDGVSEPRKFSVRKHKLLPSPRLVSVVVHDDVHSPHVRYSLMTMQWGQFVDHDLTFTPMYLTSNGHLLDCRDCNSKKTVHPECYPISVPKNDPFFVSKIAGKKKCLPFVRSINAQRTLGPREQLNQLTSYLDGSGIYGSDQCVANRLRTFRQGKLNVTRHPVRGLKDLLPRTTDNIECKAPSGFCFDAGDGRASEQPSLSCLHTIFLREHNRIAEKLLQINLHWNDEKIYQTTRKIISAFIQQITYGEFLPRLIGKDYMTRFGLSLMPNGYSNGYDNQCDATIMNEFSAAIFRLGHTLLKPSFERLDRNYQTIKASIKLREAFFNSDMIYEPYAIDQLLRGLVTSSIEKFDSSITEEVTNHLFEERRKPFSGTDLVALNLQRARDHGIPSYNYYRKLCNMTKAKSFEDLQGEIPFPVIKKLKSVYEHVDDIDLFSGGVAEIPLHGALVGPTFGCLLGMQFKILKKCDRFWYENSNEFTRFTLQQLSEIRKVTLSKIICTNADEISLIQKRSMDLQDLFLNPRIGCNSLPEMDLTKWRDFERSCHVGDKMIASGKSQRISPCVNCVCTLEGVFCQSIRVENCQQLLFSFTIQQIQSDRSCLVQCAYSIRNNQLQQSSMRTLMSMLRIGF
ncbi:heme peroxidase-like protein 1 [Sarcoptes scabiei]|uniref:Heme peroxidase-like protein 1 n=1 Tax=Sarcoptes scabiei TaxID=52283 RepID=A0A132A291_SARSC|nr:heme peroxidase-like protein 1 [Sarcoptes scabiei]